MTCQEFESMLGEDWKSPTAREHASGCAACAALLRRYAGLAAGLRALASETAAVPASQKVEDGLLKAFRAARPAVVVLPARSRRLWWAVSAAAAALVIAAVSARYPQTEPLVLVVKTPPAMDVTESLRAPSPALTAPPAPVRRAAAIRRPARPVKPVRVAAVAAKASDESSFIPLPYVAQVSPAETLDVVRVRMPRSAMMRFGLPINAERAWEPVNADIVFAQDGMARAIRFVK